MVYIPLSSLVQLGYPAITSIFVIHQIIRYLRYNEHLFFGTVTLRYNGVSLFKCHGGYVRLGDITK